MPAAEIIRMNTDKNEIGFLKGKRVLVTGACGTVGSELTKQLLQKQQVAELVGLDNNESALFLLEQKYSGPHDAHFILADLRDREKLFRMFESVDIVFHTAAFKHVSLCERSPFEAVQTNILGVRNVIDAAVACGVERVVFTSSDKAVNPTNVMGASKLMGERLVTAAHSNQRGQGPIFFSTRFGNVLWSRGSVIPLFLNQIKNGGPVTLTDERMTRFIMSTRQAVALVITSTRLARGGEVFVTKMPAVRIKDLAEVMIETFAPRFKKKPEDIQISNIGAKPGEKLYEELVSDEETRRSWELERYFVVLPALASMHRSVEYDYPGLVSRQAKRTYISADEKPLTKKELLQVLKENENWQD